MGSQFAAISAVAAYFLFGERLARIQVAGVVLIIVGVTVLAAQPPDAAAALTTGYTPAP